MLFGYVVYHYRSVNQHTHLTLLLFKEYLYEPARRHQTPFHRRRRQRRIESIRHYQPQDATTNPSYC